MAAGDIHAFPNTKEGITMRSPFIPLIMMCALGSNSEGREAGVQSGPFVALFVATLAMYLDLFGGSRHEGKR